MSLNSFLLFLLLKVYFMCCCSITNTIFLSFHINFIKFIWQPGEIHDSIYKWKVHKANSQTYPVRFPTDILFLFLVSFAFCLVFLCFFLFFFWKLKIYILIHTGLYGRVSDEKFFTTQVTTSHHPAKFGGHRHCGRGDINIPAIAVNLPQKWDIASETVYACPLIPSIFIFCKAMTCHALTHKIPD